MGPKGENIVEIAYELYSKDHDNITFDEFFDKVVTDEEFGKYFDDVLWEEALKIYRYGTK